MAGDMVDMDTVHTTEDITMERDRLKMSLLPLDQIPMLLLSLMAGDMVDMEVTTVHTEDITMERDRLKMSLLPLDQIPMLPLSLMAGDIGEDTTAHTTEVTTGENKTPANTSVSSKYFSSNNNVAAPVVMVIW